MSTEMWILIGASYCVMLLCLFVGVTFFSEEHDKYDQGDWS